MAEYDLDADIPYGLASADFPVTLYDRPSLMVSNMLRGDVDGMTRAMLSPTTLSPTQIKTTRDFFLKGDKEPNPIIKTILDIATNPLVIIGLGLGIVKFPIGTTKPLLALRRGLIPKAAAMGKVTSWAHDAMGNLRTIPGLWEAIHKQYDDAMKFAAKQWSDVDDIFMKSGPVNKAEGYMVSARLDGLHTKENSLYRLLHNEPEYIAFFGSKDVPIAANLQRKMGPRLQSIHDKMRTFYNKIRSPITKNPKVEARVIRATEKKGMPYGKDVNYYHPHHGQYDPYYAASQRGTSGVNYRKHVRAEVSDKVGKEEFARMGEMIPHMDHIYALEQAGGVPAGFRDQVLNRILDRWSAEASTTARRIWSDIGRAGLSESQQRISFVNRMTDYYTKGAGKKLNFIGRMGSPKRAADTLDSMAGALQDAQFKGVDAVGKEFLEIGKTLSRPAQYTLNLQDAASRYINSIAPTYAWHGLGNKEKVMKILDTPGIYKGAPHAESYVWDDILPHILGIKGWKQMNRSLDYTVQKAKIAGWLDNHPLPRQIMGDKATNWLSNWYKTSPIFASAESLSGSVASNFYLSTLGLNLSSSTKNMLQTWITTANVVGLRGMYYGLKGAAGQEGLFSKMNKYGKYLTEFGMDKAGREKAFRKAFPEFVEDAGGAYKIVSSMMAGDIAKEGAINIQAAKGMWGKAKEALMMPFATTEAGNRLLSYYAGRNTHLVQNAGKLAKATGSAKAAILREAGEVGQTLNMVSNFPGGPLGMPRGIINWSPAFRQFLHFPLRFGSFVGGSLRLGENPGMRDWGTIGRMLAGSTGLYIAGKNLLEVDLSGGLLTGALPLPQYEGAPFYPASLVPPILQVPGQLAMSLAKGETRGLGNVAALMVPGGIAARRAYRSLAPRYADYENPTEDGRVALYNDDKALIGTMTPLQLTLRAMGLRPSVVSAEQGAAQWLVSQRDRIRKYRREYTHAIFENDSAEAEKINQEFQQVYPELGPLKIKKSDLRALQNRREISRLHRISRGIQTSYRPIFESVIGEASLGRMTEDIEMGGMGGLQDYLSLMQ